MANLDLDSLPSKGEPVVFKHKGAEFDMVVTNARIRYGQVDVQIAPFTAGRGSFWVTYESVRLPSMNADNSPVEKALVS